MPRVENKFQELVDQQDGFNEVHIHALSDGGISITLSHRHTDDMAITVRVNDPGSVILSGAIYEQEGDQTPAERESLRRMNYGGPWDADMWNESEQYREWYRNEYDEEPPHA